MRCGYIYEGYLSEDWITQYISVEPLQELRKADICGFLNVLRVSISFAPSYSSQIAATDQKSFLQGL